MSEVSTSRRDVMRALAIVPAVIAAPAAAAAMCGRSPSLPSRAITDAIAAYHKAAAYENEWHDRAYAPVWKACKAEGEAIPHLQTKTRHEAGGKLIQWSTDNLANQTEARMCRKVIGEGHRLAGSYRQLVEEFEEKMEWRAAEQRRIEQRHGMDALDAEQERITDLSYAAMKAVDDFPVTTLADLMAKTEFGKETDGQIDHEALLADLRRIAGRAMA